MIRCVAGTIRIKIDNEPQGAGPWIIGGWHGRSVLFTYGFRHRGYGVMVSHSRDGEMYASVFQRLGYHVVRGSTGRGGARALIEAIRLMRQGMNMAMTPDGPRGPTHVCQMGVITLAQRSGAQLVPASVGARPRILANSWDRYQIPIPFGRGLILMGEPIAVPADADENELEAIRLRYEQAMNAIEVEVDRRLGYPPSTPSVS